MAQKDDQQLLFGRNSELRVLQRSIITCALISFVVRTASEKICQEASDVV